MISQKSGATLADGGNQVKIGLLGGGQLGRMLVEAASRLNLSVTVLDNDTPAPNQTDKLLGPAKQITAHAGINGSFKDPAAIAQLAKMCSHITVEIEHVDTDALQAITSSNIIIQPDFNTLRIIQDKFSQKEFIQKTNPSIPISPFRQLYDGDPVAAIAAIGKEFGYPMMLKSKRLAYDGRGNKVVKNEADIAASIATLRGSNGNATSDLYVEQWVPFIKELAVMVAKSSSGDIVSYPCVETVQKDNICHLVIVPAQVDGVTRSKARAIAEKVASCFSGYGIFGVELFLLPNGDITYNEVAPRPHNSGHYTIEACHTSQYEQHLRCLTGMPLGSPDLKVPAAIMVNVLGEGDGEAGMAKTLEICKRSLLVPGATVHLYGKIDCKKGRKMGHITIVGDFIPHLLASVAELLQDQTLPETISPTPLVGLIMGSDSDLPVVKPAALILKGFGVPFEVTIVSAHRTPQRMVDYARLARKRGIKVIIAAAGGAAHLPGMVAALTPLPVIGIPVALKFLDGVDSLHSIVQMPRGVPVATVAINNAVNAGLLAIRILGASVPILLDNLEQYTEDQESDVMIKVELLATRGWEEYENTSKGSF